MAIDRSMSLVRVAREIHKNAVDHGWWDGERDIAEIYALIHSEWSEALEEARAGRDDVWFACDERLVCNKAGREECGWHECKWNETEIVCDYRGKKPEGICVELIDGVIRILDYIGYKSESIDYGDMTIDGYISLVCTRDRWADMQGMSVGSLVMHLHSETADAGRKIQAYNLYLGELMSAVQMVWMWIKSRGLDPMQLLIEKHEYNVTRPYKHGKKF